MSTIVRISALQVAFVFILSALTASYAQVFDDIENAVTRGSQFNETLEDFSDRPVLDEDELTIDGEAGVYILKKNDIFAVGAILGAGYADNPSRTQDSDVDPSAAVQFALTAGIDTKINKQIDAGLNIGLSGTEYDKSGAPDNRNVFANAYLGKTFGDGEFFGSVSGSYGQAMNGTFNDGTGFYGLNASVTTIRPVSDRVIFRPRVTVSRQWSEVSEQENTSISADAGIVWAIASKWQVSGSISYTHRVYDDFFEDVTFVERKDDVWRASLGVARQINDKVAISGNITFVDQSSDFFLSEYDSLDGGLSLSLRRKF